MDDEPPGLVEAYWRYHALGGSKEPADWAKRNATFWAWEWVNDAAMANRPGVVELLGRLLAAAPDEESVFYLAAGPLEDLIVYQGSAVFGEVENAARTDPRMRLALTGVYVSRVDPDVLARLRRYGLG